MSLGFRQQSCAWIDYLTTLGSPRHRTAMILGYSPRVSLACQRRDVACCFDWFGSFLKVTQVKASNMELYVILGLIGILLTQIGTCVYQSRCSKFHAACIDIDMDPRSKKREKSESSQDSSTRHNESSQDSSTRH